MASNNINLFESQKPQDTYTIDQFIACQSDETICYNNLSFIDQIGNIKYNTYNVLSDYIEEIKNDYAVVVTLTEEQMIKYKYRPKLLCYDIYGNGELAFIIMIINDMCDVKEFTKNKLFMLRKTDMTSINKYLYNANKNDINIYNEKNKTT